MKIYDCITFYNEKMLFDLRLNILDKYVHKFVVSESLYSHSGMQKKLNFNLNDFPKFKDKIIYIIIDKEPVTIQNISDIKDNNKKQMSKRINSLLREKLSREILSKGIIDADDNDLIMYSDSDEIPNLENINFNKYQGTIFLFKQLIFYYKFNLIYDRIIWHGTKACYKKDFISCNWLRNIKNKEYPFWRLDTFFSSNKYTNIKIIDNGGWHFTKIKTAEDIYAHLSNDAHHNEFELSDLNKEKIQNLINKRIVYYDHTLSSNNKNKFNSNYQLKKIDLNLLPKYLLKNQEKFKDWFDFK